jgi:hypothetical protein
LLGVVPAEGEDREEARGEPDLGGGECERAGWRVPVVGDDELIANDKSIAG